MVYPISVLLIEESESDAEIILTHLEQAGYSVSFQWVNNIHSLSAALEKQPWEFIISDYSLTDFSASAALAYLQSKDMDIPFVVISDDIPDKEAVGLLRSGAIHCIPKDRLARLGSILKRELTFAGARRESALKQVQDLLEIRTRQLQESEEHFRLLTENTSDVIWISDLNMQTIYISPSVERMLGIPVKAYLNLTLEERFTPETILKLHNLLKEELEKENDPVVDRNRSILVEVDHNHSDGRILRLELHMSFTRDELGKAVGIQGVTRDITERSRIEQELSLKSLVLDQIQDLVTITDLQGRIFFVNEAEAKTMGIPKAEFIGKTTEFYGEDVERGAAQKEIIENTIRDGAYRCEVVNRTSDGRELILDCRTQVVYGKSDNPVALCGISTDITDRKRLEAALENRILALTRPLDQPEGIEFEDLFDLEDMQRFQDQFSAATNVASIITHPDGTPITQPSNFCRLCKDIIRKTAKGQINCFKSDAALGRYHPDGPIIQPCKSGGLWDAGAGISVGGRHIANWLIGQVRDETQTEENIRSYARLIGANEKVVVEAFYEVPSMSRDQFEKVAQALFTTAKQISTLAYQNVQQARFITENKKAEEQLRTSEQNFREVFNSTSEAIFIDDAETGKIIDVNESMLKMYGFDNKEEILRGNIGDLSANEPPFTEDQAQELVRKSIYEGPQVFEWLAKKRDGSRFWTEVSLKKSRIGGNDRVLAVVRDVTERKLIEENLKKSEKHFRSLFELTAVGVAITDAHTGEYLEVNDRFCEITGYIAGELIGMTFSSMTHPDDLHRNIEFIDRLLAGTIRNFSLEKRYIRKDGSTIWVEVTVAPMWDPGEEPNSNIAVVQDITARKQSEQALRTSEERFRRLSDDIPVCISSFLPDSTCTYANSVQAGLLGLHPDQIIGRKFYDLLNPDDMLLVKNHLEGLNPSNPTEFHEQKHILPNGEERIIEWRNRAFFDGSGNITHLLGVGVDITDRNAVENALRKSEEKFSTAFHVSPDSVNINRMIDGLFIDINEGFTRLTGYTNDDVRGKTSLELNIWVNPEDRVRLVSGLKDSGQVNNLEASFRAKNGQTITGLMSAKIIEVNGEKCLLSITRDITDRKQIEIALQKSEERYHLIDEASQDLIYSYDRDGRFTHANSSLCRLLGLSPEEIVGKTHTELGFPQETCDEWDRLHLQVYKTNTTVISETIAPIQGSDPIYFEVVLNPIHDEAGIIVGIAGMTRNITERKLAEIQINQQLDELRRWHNATLGREKRILELKREINRMLVEAGQPPRYASPGEVNGE